jgi:DNA-binding IscR family transcriptional regulator
MSLKNSGLLIGVSGKKGGYQLAKSPGEIKILEIVQAVSGPITTTECVNHPEICLNSWFCEARVIWSLISNNIVNELSSYSLEDMINKNWIDDIRKSNPDVRQLNPDLMISEIKNDDLDGSPVGTDKK